MSSGGSRSGIFYFKNLGPVGAFPKTLRRSPLSRIEPRFTALFAGLLVAIGAAIWILSHQKIKEEGYSEKEILKIQERYAQLVLNQPKPKVEPVEKEPKAKVEKTTVDTKQGKTEEAAKQKTPKVDREKESFVQREERREATRETREEVRQQVRQQVMSSGIFAAITATGGGGSTSDGPQVSDFLGTASADLSEIGSMNISKGTFAAKNVDAVASGEAGLARKGERVSNVGIEKQTVGKAAVTQLASAGNVNITSQAPEVTGEASNIEERSQSAIARVVTRETQRLKRVYEDWLKRDPQLSGRLKVKFQILPNGSVANVTIIESTTNNSEFDDAILRYIRRWQFSEASAGGPVEVVYPFVFEGQS